MASPVVIDLGSYAIKAGKPVGYPNDHEPSVVLPTVVEDTRQPGTEVQPISSGSVTDWEALESLLDTILYQKLGWGVGQEGPIIFCEPVLAPREDRERLTQLAFEGLGATGIFVVDQAVLSLYAAGKTSGIVVDYGLDKIDVSPVLDGQLAALGATRFPVGGSQLTELVRSVATRQGLSLDATVAENLKRACLDLTVGQALPHHRAPSPSPGTEGAVATQDRLVTVSASSFTLPDGQQIELEPFRTGATPALLEPALLAAYSIDPYAPILGTSLPELVASLGLSLPDKELRKAMLSSILVAGGAAGVKGLGSQLVQEVQAALPGTLTASTAEIPEHMPTGTATVAAWAGGALLSKVLVAQDQWVSRGDYEEGGPTTIHHRCL